MVFIASSSTAYPMVQALANCLEKGKKITCTPWKAAGVFNGYPFPDLLLAANKCHYAVFVMWPDDELKQPISGNQTRVTRDNVIFEAGLFSGILNSQLWRGDIGSEKRVFLWVNSSHNELHIPSDVSALSQERYELSGSITSMTLQQIINEITCAADLLADKILQHWKSINQSILLSETLNQSLLNAFRREWTIVPPRPPPPVYTPNPYLLDTDDLYDSFVACGGAPKSGAVIIDSDTRWLWDLFPLILHWRCQGTRVSVAARRQDKISQEEAGRRELLKNLGCQFVEQDVKERLFILNPKETTETIVFRFENEKHFFATRRTRDTDEMLVKMIDKQVEDYGLKVAYDGTIPRVESATESEIIDKLKSENGPPPYQDPSVKMHMEDVNLENAYSISTMARTYRFRQSQLIASLFKKHSIPAFDPAAVVFPSGSKSLITPPIVEKWGSDYIFIEGNTRALYSLCSGAKSIRALVLTGVTTLLPADKIPFQDVFLNRLKLPSAWRQRNWDYNKFRNIEAAVHNY
jgi:hypothetical protein